MTDKVEFTSEPFRILDVDAHCSDERFARAAWVSHTRNAHEKEADDKSVPGLIDFLWRNKHTSPFEHGQFTFMLETPIFVAREFMRHRTWSYNEVSGRYSVLAPRFYVPGPGRPLIQTGKVGSYTFEHADEGLAGSTSAMLRVSSQADWRAYECLLEDGIAKEVARMVLPVNLMTTFWATVNPLNLMRFLSLRADEQAMYEIRMLAEAMADEAEKHIPLTVGAWRKHGI